MYKYVFILIWAVLATSNKLTKVVELTKFSSQNSSKKTNYYGGVFDIDVYDINTDDPRIFVAIGNVLDTDSISLGYFSSSNSKQIIAYPSLKWHKNKTNCQKNRIISPTHIKIDNCDRLWVLDSGHLNGTQICKPQILAFNLTNKRLVYKYAFQKSGTYLANFVVDQYLECMDPFVYIADTQLNSLIVLNLTKRKFWQFSDKRKIKRKQASLSFFVSVGMSLSSVYSPASEGRPEILFYNGNYWIFTSLLRNKNTFILKDFPRKRNSNVEDIGVRKLVNYYGNFNESQIRCWDILKPFSEKSTDVVANIPNGFKLRSLKIIKNKNDDELWILIFNKKNYQILKESTNLLLNGTKCFK